MSFLPFHLVIYFNASRHNTWDERARLVMRTANINPQLKRNWLVILILQNAYYEAVMNNVQILTDDLMIENVWKQYCTVHAQKINPKQKCD